MERLNGWWMMIVVCVASGLWFFAMPLLGYGYSIDGITVRPGWLGVPPCLFGAVYAARSTPRGWLTGILAGVVIFAATFLSGVQFRVMQATHIPGCALWGQVDSCAAVEVFEDGARTWDPAGAIGRLRNPAAPSTFISARP